MASGLFKGNGKVILVSHNKTLAAVSGNPDIIGKQYTSLDPYLKETIHKLNLELNLHRGNK